MSKSGIDERWRDTIPVDRAIKPDVEGDEHNGPSPFFFMAVSAIAGAVIMFCIADMLRF